MRSVLDSGKALDVLNEYVRASTTIARQANTNDILHRIVRRRKVWASFQTVFLSMTTISLGRGEVWVMGHK